MSLALVRTQPVLTPPWVKNDLWRRARAVPSLDLQFADNKSLVDATTGQNLVSFTRASSGTYVDSQGVIRTATTNLKTFSENFSDTSYSVSTRLTVTADALAAPNGTVTADKLVATSNSDQKFVETTASVTSGFAYVFGIFAKKAEYEVLQISVANTYFLGTLAYANFNLSSGSIVSSADCTPVIQAIGNGWYRCSVIMAAATGTGVNAFRFSPYASGNPGRLASYTGDGTSGIYLWGAQLEQSSTVGEYIPTTSTINSAPRFDHNPTTGESLGLLVEESRTNFATQSESFSGWTVAGLTQTTAAVLNPSGATGVQLFTEDTANSTHRLFVSPTTGQATNSFSVWVKPALGSRLFYIEADNASGIRRTIRFNLQTGVLDSNTGDWSNVFITSFPNGWFRVGGTITDNGGTVLVICGNSSGTSAFYTGDGTSGFYLWGAQLEAGAFPTSYIPTTTATATRSADVASISGSNFSSWYRQDEGTVFAETQFSAGTAVNSSSRSVFDATDGSTNNRVNLRPIGGGITADQLTIRSVGSTTAQFSSNGTAVSTASRKLAAVYKVDDFASWATGATSVATDTSGAIPVGVNQVIIGGTVGATEYLSGTIRRLVYWGQRLPNNVLQAITQ